jgi:uncharacterized damage-inducible protein DinB
MSGPALGDAFAHHVWATLRLLDTCAAIGLDQMMAPVPGTYGSILGTLRHLVGGDCYYLSMLNESTRLIDEDRMDLAELRATMESNAATWSALLVQDLDPDAVIRDVDAQGYQRYAPIGVRLAQALHHGSDHRSQVCTALTVLGVEPPSIDVWAFALDSGRTVEIPPAP